MFRSNARMKKMIPPVLGWSHHFVSTRISQRRALLLALAITFYLIVLLIIRKYGITRELLEPVLGPMQRYGTPILFLLQFISSLTPLPDNFLIYAGVIIFGASKTFFTVYSSYVSATCVSFAIARRFGKERIFRRFPKMIEKIESYDQKLKPHNLIVYRFFSFSSMDYLAYIAGFSNISFKSYLFASLITMPLLIIPAILLVQGLFERNPLLFGIIYICLAFMMFFTSFIVKLLEKLMQKVE